VRVPVVIVCRDRLAPLKELVAWCETKAGLDEIYLLDNDSAFEPLLDWYRETPHTVVRLGRNLGKWALWEDGETAELVRGREFVYTDPDIVPVDECPADAIDRFAELLERYPGVTKAGFGLKIDDLPDAYPHKQAVLDWEGQMWRWPLGDGAWFAPIDSTFALYRAGAGLRPAEGIRTGAPYLARHTDWYVDPQALSEEERFHRERPGTRGNWSKRELPEWFAPELERLRAQPGWLRRTLRDRRTRAQIRRRVRG
jgi:hypothetical protein